MLNKNRAIIGDNSNGNTVIQDCVIKTPIIASTQHNDVLQFLANEGEYSAIQKLARNQFEEYEKIHPLYPSYSAEFDSKLKRLVSTPQTDEAIKRYPKTIRETVIVNLQEYPDMDKAETPWEYAYRTQTKVKLLTSEYQEFLGDVPDPFPTIEYQEGMKTIICPPPFPPGVEAMISSDEITLPIRLQRIPCRQFGIDMFEGIPKGHAIRIILKHNKVEKKLTGNIEFVDGLSLVEQLMSRRFLYAILNTRQICIYIGETQLCTLFTKGDIADDNFYKDSPFWIKYLEGLLSIQEFTGCKFCEKIDTVSQENFMNVCCISASLKGEWFGEKKDFDNAVRCNYDEISEEIISSRDPTFEELWIERQNITVLIHGQYFMADKYTIVYKRAKINNLRSVIKNYYKKKRNIMITIRPQDGDDNFIKYCRYENLAPLAETANNNEIQIE